MTNLEAFLVVGRKEYMPSAINEVGLPALLAVLAVGFGGGLFIWAHVALAVWLLAHLIGAQINCLADYDLDRRFKSRLPAAIDLIGKRVLKRWIWVEVVGTTLIVLAVTIGLRRPLLLVFWILGVILALLYSVPPVRLKGRVLWNPVTLTLVLYVLPMFFVLHLLTGGFDLLGSTVILLFSVQMVPMFLVDEVSDMEEDREVGLKTPCVVWGRGPVTLAATGIYILSAVGLVATFFAFRMFESPWAWVLVATAVVLYGKVVADLVKLWARVRKFESLETATTRPESLLKLKRSVVVPRWLMSSGAAAIAMACAALL